MRTANRNPSPNTLFSAFAAVAFPAPPGSGASWFDRAGATIRLWRKRSQDRRELLTLDDHVRRDIGLSRYEVAREARKPFWRA